MRSFFVAAAASLVAVATAQGTKDAPALPLTYDGTKAPSGNDLTKPGLGEQVPVGKPYAITWTPTPANCDRVGLCLLRGPGENIKQQEWIAWNIENSGTYQWTPSNTLENDNTHYGIQLFCCSDTKDKFQFTPQFGVSNPNGAQASNSTTTATPSGPSGSSVPSGTSDYPTPSVSLLTGNGGTFGTYHPPPPLSTEVPATTSCPPTMATSAAAAAPTYAANKTVSTLPTPTQTAGAANVKVAVSMLVGVMAVAFAL